MSYRYKTVKRGGKTVLLHRWLMEQHLGRSLLDGEQVHHRNHDPKDNRIENLELTTSESHQHHHHPPEYQVEKTCVVCLGRFTPHKTKRKRQQTCSWKCRNALIAVRRHGVPLERVRAEVAEALVRANIGDAAGKERAA
ncbi:MAG TPA: HNH endonuclease signature motif containing protein [Actinomycetota bacterium]